MFVQLTDPEEMESGNGVGKWSHKGKEIKLSHFLGTVPNEKQNTPRRSEFPLNGVRL